MNAIALFTIIFFAFYWWIRFKQGVTPSLSADFYRLQAKGHSHHFDTFFYIVGVSMWFYGFYSYSPYTSILLVIAGLFLCVVPIAPFFKIAKVATIHYIGATGAIGFGFWAVTFEYWDNKVIALIPLAVFLISVLVMKLKKVSNYTTWVELAAAGCIYFRLLIL